MSVKSYGSTFDGPCFQFVADDWQIADFLFRNFQGIIDRIEIAIGEKLLLESGAILRKVGQNVYKLYGYEGKLDVLGDESILPNSQRLPVDLIEELEFIFEQQLYISWEFI